MESYIVARIIHVLCVVLWIGGVAMVTTVILPMVRKCKNPKDRQVIFEQIEHRFAKQARIITLLAGLSGFFMLYITNSWHRLLDWHYWWIHAMILIWSIYVLMLFVLEPLFFEKLFKKQLQINEKRAFQFAYLLHFFLLILSLITVIGAVGGSHGLF